jgi:hypothetical protein
MSLTEHIIEIVERGWALGLPDEEVDQMLYAIGCIRVIHRPDALIVCYYDQDGVRDLRSERVFGSVVTLGFAH